MPAPSQSPSPTERSACFGSRDAAPSQPLLASQPTPRHLLRSHDGRPMLQSTCTPPCLLFWPPPGSSRLTRTRATRAQPPCRPSLLLGRHSLQLEGRALAATAVHWNPPSQRPTKGRRGSRQIGLRWNLGIQSQLHVRSTQPSWQVARPVGQSGLLASHPPSRGCGSAGPASGGECTAVHVVHVYMSIACVAVQHKRS